MDSLFIQYFSFINVIDEKTNEPKIKDVDLERLKHVCEGYNKVLALGGFASTALSKAGINHHKLPHPSPRNRLFNDKSFESKILNECSKYLKG